jgi:hypothetical protein
MEKVYSHRVSCERKELTIFFFFKMPRYRFTLTERHRIKKEKEDINAKKYFCLIKNILLL